MALLVPFQVVRSQERPPTALGALSATYMWLGLAMLPNVVPGVVETTDRLPAPGPKAHMASGSATTAFMRLGLLKTDRWSAELFHYKIFLKTKKRNSIKEIKE